MAEKGWFWSARFAKAGKPRSSSSVNVKGVVGQHPVSVEKEAVPGVKVQGRSRSAGLPGPLSKELMADSELKSTSMSAWSVAAMAVDLDDGSDAVLED